MKPTEVYKSSHQIVVHYDAPDNAMAVSATARGIVGGLDDKVNLPDFDSVIIGDNGEIVLQARPNVVGKDPEDLLHEVTIFPNGRYEDYTVYDDNHVLAAGEYARGVRYRGVLDPKKVEELRTMLMKSAHEAPRVIDQTK